MQHKPTPRPSLFQNSMIQPAHARHISEKELNEIRLLFNEYVTTALKVVDVTKEVANAFRFILEKVNGDDAYSEEEIRLIAKAAFEFNCASIVPQDVMVMVDDVDGVLTAIHANPLNPIQDINYTVPTHYGLEDENTADTKQVKAAELSKDDLTYLFGIVHDFFRTDDVSTLSVTATTMVRTMRWARLNQAALEQLKVKIVEKELLPPKKEKNKTDAPGEIEIAAAVVVKPKTTEEHHAYALNNYLSILMTRGQRLELQFTNLLRVYTGIKHDELYNHLLGLQLKMRRHVVTTETYDAIGDERFNRDTESLNEAAKVDLMVTVSKTAGAHIRKLTQAQPKKDGDILIACNILQDNIFHIMRILRQGPSTFNDISELKIHFRQLEVPLNFCLKALLEKNLESNSKEYSENHELYNDIVMPFIGFLNRRNAGIENDKDIILKAADFIAGYQEHVTKLEAEREDKIKQLNAEKEKEKDEMLDQREMERIAALQSKRKLRPRLHIEEKEKEKPAPTIQVNRPRLSGHFHRQFKADRPLPAENLVSQYDSKKLAAISAAFLRGIESYLNIKPTNKLQVIWEKNNRRRANSYQHLLSTYTEPSQQLFLMYTLLASHAEKGLQMHVIKECSPFFPRATTLKELRNVITKMMAPCPDEEEKLRINEAVGLLVEQIAGKDIVKECTFPSIKSAQLKHG